MEHISHVIVGFLVALFVCYVLSFFSARICSLITRPDLTARQATHVRPTLRLGGVGIIAGIWVVALTTKNDLLLILLACSLPVLITGFLEDVGFAQSATARLLAAALSSVIVITITGTHIQNSGTSLLDYLLTITPFAILLTIFATVGLIHAFNLIDGVNGLGGSVALVAALGLAWIGYRAGVDVMELPVAAVAGSILGFLVLNYPLGRIFLGDAGAYTVGFLLAWMAVFLLAEFPTVSPWALILLFFWPIADTLLAIYRRLVLRAPIGAPDRLHAHHVAMRLIEIVVLQRRDRRFSNPMATLAVVPLILPPALVGVLLWNDPLLSGIALIGFAVLFVGFYHLAIARVRRLRAAAKVMRRRHKPTVPAPADTIFAESKVLEVNN